MLSLSQQRCTSKRRLKSASRTCAAQHMPQGGGSQVRTPSPLSRNSQRCSQRYLTYADQRHDYCQVADCWQEPKPFALRT